MPVSNILHLSVILSTSLQYSLPASNILYQFFYYLLVYNILYQMKNLCIVSSSGLNPHILVIIILSESLSVDASL